MFDMIGGTAANNKENKISLLKGKLEQVELMISSLLSQYDLNYDDLLSFIESAENRSDNIKAALDDIRKELEQNLQTELSAIGDGAALTKRYEELRQARQWLYVR